MKKMKTVLIAIALFVGATSFVGAIGRAHV